MPAAHRSPSNALFFVHGIGLLRNRLTNIEQMVPATDDTSVRAQVIAMIERCPSGSYMYSIETGAADIEPDLPQQIALTTEILSEDQLRAIVGDRQYPDRAIGWSAV